MPSRGLKKLDTAETDGLSEIVERAAVRKERVVLTREGKPIAAVVPLEDGAVLEVLEDELDAAELRTRVAEWHAEGCPIIPLDEIAVRYGLGERQPE